MPIDTFSASLIPPGWQDAHLEPTDCETVILNIDGQQRQLILPIDNQGGLAASIFLPPYGTASGIDEDEDGILDVSEQLLAEQYAPIVYHDKDDFNLPTNVDWLLKHTHLEYYNNNGLFHRDDHLPIAGPPLAQGNLLGKSGRSQNGAVTVLSDGTRSRNRQHTFAVLDVADDLLKQGSLNTSEWTTYYHAFRNYYGGVTIQYWRFYAYNTGNQGSIPVDNHGGDWECVQVILDKALNPVSFRFLGHTNIEVKLPTEVKREGEHVIVFSEPGGHASHAICNPEETITIPILGFQHRIWLKSLNDPINVIRQEVWQSGQVQWPTADWRGHLGGLSTPSGGLVNIGSKLHPLNGQLFVQYSGLWGSLGQFFSGYWGPAFNETEMRSDGFVSAWAYGMKASKGNFDILRSECFPAATCE